MLPVMISMEGGCDSATMSSKVLQKANLFRHGKVQDKQLLAQALNGIKSENCRLVDFVGLLPHFLSKVGVLVVRRQVLHHVVVGCHVLLSLGGVRCCDSNVFCLPPAMKEVQVDEGGKFDIA